MANDRVLRVAIVGSGPSGFYAAEALFKADARTRVDMFERLPTPYGLVRGGVAPDHPKIKSVTRVFDRIASHENFTFLGNVTVGRDISVEELIRHYDAIIFACGAEADRRLGIPGEDLPGSHTATEFVAWYNGHPDYRNRTFDLSAETAIVVGQGNVAMDVCRILAKTPDELRHTDMAAHAFEALAESRVREIILVGRRGPVQAKFTTPEIREIGSLADCAPMVDPAELVLDEMSRAELEDPSNKHSPKNMAVLEEFAARALGGVSRCFRIRFLLSPTELKGGECVESALFERNRLEGQPFALSSLGTGIFEEIPCGLFFRSVGYRGVPIPGVPFDERRGVFPNRNGRILDNDTPVPRLYATGWIKRGPSGIIGTNKPDSVETVEALRADMAETPPCEAPDTSLVHELLASRGVRVVSFADWQRIDAAETARGAQAGKPREKFVSFEEILSVLDT